MVVNERKVVELVQGGMSLRTLGKHIYDAAWRCHHGAGEPIQIQLELDGLVVEEVVAASDSNPASVEVTWPQAFEWFWKHYPRHVAKIDAHRAWMTADPGPKHQAAVFKQIASTLARLKATDWKDKDPRYIPYPATWLNGRRWEDQ